MGQCSHYCGSSRRTGESTMTKHNSNDLTHDVADAVDGVVDDQEDSE